MILQNDILWGVNYHERGLTAPQIRELGLGVGFWYSALSNAIAAESCINLSALSRQENKRCRKDKVPWDVSIILLINVRSSFMTDHSVGAVSRSRGSIPPFSQSFSDCALVCGGFSRRWNGARIRSKRYISHRPGGVTVDEYHCHNTQDIWVLWRNTVPRLSAAPRLFTPWSPGQNLHFR